LYIRSVDRCPDVGSIAIAAPAGTPPKQPITRCAVYTRKSTSEGLDQAFNSLDAQRESCEAYIASQKALGWQTIPRRYDDGGFTGANMERPALQRLLADIEAEKTDCVAVYKVDRISRSLLDFARMMETFDKHGVSFVSVTQHFNTATPMGRLILNILLSFAQFEREIISERTRDKIAAARRRGQWCGGRPILGYDLVPGEHRLTVHPVEAEQVRAIFQMYLDKESVLSAAREFNARGWTTKRWTAANGRVIGGRPFDRANLHHLLTNVAYVGRVRYRDETHAGQHQAIVDSTTWERVQRLLLRNARTAGSFLRNKHGALLKGLLRCKACDAAMVQMVSKKGPKLHRYYVCTKAQKRGYDQCPTGTILAGRLEREVCDHLRRLAEDSNGPPGRARNGRAPGVRDHQAGRIREEGPAAKSDEVNEFLACDWNNLPPLEQARLLRFILDSVEYDGRTERVALTLTTEAAANLAQLKQGADLRPFQPTEESRVRVGGQSEADCPASREAEDGRDSVMHIEFAVSSLKPTQRRRREQSHGPSPAASAVRTIVLAYQIEQAVRDGRARDYADVAKQIGMTRARVSQITRLLRLPAALLETLLLADPVHCPRLTERQLRPLVAASPSTEQLEELERRLSQVQRRSSA
jgi:DNA invertase Pin-like site-specific DNA recombinase